MDCDQAVTESFRYRQARDHIGYMMRAILNSDFERTADELLGYAHGCDDMAYHALGLSNQKRHADEEAEWARLMAL